MNRLSDFFFVAARFAALHEKREEITYRKARAPKASKAAAAEDQAQPKETKE